MEKIYLLDLVKEIRNNKSSRGSAVNIKSVPQSSVCLHIKSYKLIYFSFVSEVKTYKVRSIPELSLLRMDMCIFGAVRSTIYFVENY